MAVAEINKEMEELKSGVAEITSALKALKIADTSGVRRDSDGRITGFVADTDEALNLRFSDGDGSYPEARSQKSYRAQKAHCSKSLQKAGYVPRGEFQTAREFFLEGLEKGNTEAFRARHQKHFGSSFKAIQGMNEGTGTDGGFTVMPEFSTNIIDRIYENDLWGRTDNYTVSGNNMTFLANKENNRANGSRHGGLTGGWYGEGAAITKSKPGLREVSLKLCKLGVVVYLTEELLKDTSQALESYVARKAAEEFNFLIGDSLFNGTGVGQPLGILNAPSLVSVAKEGSQGAATILSENVVKMYGRFYAPNLGNAAWYHNQDIQSQLQLMTIAIGTGGAVTYMPPGGLSQAPYGVLQGRPMLPTEFNSTLGTQGDLVLADLKQVLSISKGGIEQAVSMHVEFLSDQTALKFTMRLNARPWEDAPITPYKGTANTQSNFVALDTRA